MKLDRGDYVGDITPQANFGISTPKGAVLHMREIVIDDRPCLFFYTAVTF